MENENRIQEEVLDVKGMHCKSCVERIENKLAQMRGVDKARVSFVEEKAYVRFDPSQTNLKKIKSEIANLGYEAGVGGKMKSTDAGEKKSSSTIKQGIIYGLLPHTGCIAFIVASVLGVTFATQLFKPLLLNPYFFYILIAISFVFATVSAIVYLKKQGFINFNRGKAGSELNFSSGIIKRKWKYISTLYGTTIGINLLLFMIIFPLMANISSPSITGAVAKAANNVGSLSLIKLQVDIPCSGHASLISQELKTINGVSGVQFSLPNIFDVKYDSTKISKQQILSLEVFKTYKATVLEESSTSQNTQNLANQPSSSTGQPSAASVGGGCGGAGGGSCCGGGGGCGCGSN